MSALPPKAEFSHHAASVRWTKPHAASFEISARSESLNLPRSFKIAPTRSRNIARRSGSIFAATSMTLRNWRSDRLNGMRGKILFQAHHAQTAAAKQVFQPTAQRPDAINARLGPQREHKDRA
jgi:hypothetical protein